MTILVFANAHWLTEHMSTFDIHYTSKVSGAIPDAFSCIIELTVLCMSFNSLNGSLPEAIGFLPKLSEIQLQLNKLSGNIPDRVGLLSAVFKLYLSNNHLSGSIPDRVIRSGKNDPLKDFEPGPFFLQDLGMLQETFLSVTPSMH